MVDVFCSKFFHGEVTVTLETLQGTKQKSREDLMEYIMIFRDIALDCHDHLRENISGNVYGKDNVRVPCHS